jgi:membrane-bound lytic murein transglycosylase B
MTRVLVILSLLFFALPAAAKGKAKAPVPPKADWKYAEKRLRKEGFKKKFIAALKKSYEPEPFKDVLELNTLLFLKKSDYHGTQVNDTAIEDVKSFMTANQNSLAVAEKDYGVPGGVVASLLWMESRHGKNLGAFDVPSVFVDLVQCDRPANIKYLHKAGTRFTPHVTAQNKRDITSRAKKRVKWALAELKAIQTMYQRNPKALVDFRGSFAGAFGMSQFEPSSYVAYAVAQVGDHPPVLEHSEDAIESVAHYLHENGWRMSKKKSYVKALMRYNNSHDYAAAILKLARQASPSDPNSKRLPAGK